MVTLEHINNSSIFDVYSILYLWFLIFISFIFPFSYVSYVQMFLLPWGIFLIYKPTWKLTWFRFYIAIAHYFYVSFWPWLMSVVPCFVWSYRLSQCLHCSHLFALCEFPLMCIYQWFVTLFPGLCGMKHSFWSRPFQLPDFHRYTHTPHTFSIRKQCITFLHDMHVCCLWLVVLFICF